MKSTQYSEDREQEIGDRPGERRWRTRFDALAVERAMQPRAASTVAFALVEHLHVAAERKRRDRPFGRRGPSRATSSGRAEADREAQHLHAAEPRDAVVAELVDDDQQPERDEEGDDGVSKFMT